jgi:hypothetical protein
MVAYRVYFLQKALPFSPTSKPLFPFNETKTSFVILLRNDL